MSFDVYQKDMEEKGRKDHEILELKDLVFKMGVAMNNLTKGFELYKKEFELYRSQFGNRSLTEAERERLREAREQKVRYL
jgi:hypothetical protein